MKIGDIAVIRDTNFVPGHWPLAKVIKTYPGDDDIVTVATVKTAKGTCNHPLHNLLSQESDTVVWTYELKVTTNCYY